MQHECRIRECYPIRLNDHTESRFSPTKKNGQSKKAKHLELIRANHEASSMHNRGTSATVQRTTGLFRAPSLPARVPTRLVRTFSQHPLVLSPDLSLGGGCDPSNASATGPVQRASSLPPSKLFERTRLLPTVGRSTTPAMSDGNLTRIRTAFKAAPRTEIDLTAQGSVGSYLPGKHIKTEPAEQRIGRVRKTHANALVRRGPTMLYGVPLHPTARVCAFLLVS